MSWIGKKRVAFVPVDRGDLNEQPLPPNWRDLIEQRIYYWPDQLRGVDVSLRNYLYTTSQGRADIEGVVQEIYPLHQQDVPVDFLASELEQKLRNDHCDAAVLVMLGGFSTGSADVPGFWARVAMVEGVGVWAMEITHAIAGYADLYTNDRTNDLNSFDNMDCSCGTHPTAYTKMQLGWLDPSAIVVDSATSADFQLHTLGLIQPPPSGRCTAIRIETGGNPLFVEARQRVDQYDGGNWWNKDSHNLPVGISSEGVIVYELAGVENQNAPPGQTDPLIRLLTLTALLPGGVFRSQSGVTVRVTAALPGGFAVTIENPSAPVVVVPDVFQLPFLAAVNAIRAAGLVPSPITGTNNLTVKTQHPLAGTLVARGSTVSMTLTSIHTQ
jgi:PASTA domain